MGVQLANHWLPIAQAVQWVIAVLAALGFGLLSAIIRYKILITVALCLVAGSAVMYMFMETLVLLIFSFTLSGIAFGTLVPYSRMSCMECVPSLVSGDATRWEWGRAGVVGVCVRFEASAGLRTEGKVFALRHGGGIS